ncbi:alpha/beta-hydrolase, partial [Panus rudis PR-1116 ss-1]
HEPIQLPSGLVLEASLSLPQTAGSNNSTSATSQKLAVCLHPWSWLGGRMDDGVLEAVSRPLRERGYYVLRYNSRGVGKSSGWPSLTGTQEGKDLQEVVQWALGRIPDVQQVVILGYSHGALIASLFPLLPEPIRVSHILLSYPLGPRSWLTAFCGRTYTTALNSLLHDPRSNVLVIYGDCDEFTSEGRYDAWASDLRKEISGGRHGTLHIEKIVTANHFWVDYEARNSLLTTVRNWVP